MRAYDTAGTRDPTPATYSFTVDTGWIPGPDAIPPETTITQSPGPVVSFTSPVFRFSSSESGSTFECRLEPADALGSVDFNICSNGSGGVDATAADRTGDFVFSVRATDANGNTDPSPAVAEIRITSNTWIDRGPSGTVDYNDVLFHMNAIDPDTTAFGPLPDVTFQCKLESGGAPGAAAFETCTDPNGYFSPGGPLPDGQYTFSARAIDENGVVDPTPNTRTFTVDTSRPDTALDSGPSGTVADNTPAFEFSSTIAAATFECSIDYLEYFTCASGYELPVLPEGAHSFRIRAVLAGAADLTPVSATFTVDTDPASVTPPAAGCAVASQTVACTSSANQMFDYVQGCSIDGARMVGCGRSFVVRLSAGMHTITLTIVNDIGQARTETLVVNVPA